MHEFLAEFAASQHWVVLVAVLIGSILLLGKGADWLVDEAVHVSVRLGLPRVIVGATLVSLGTTMPEAVVSVLAAFQGNSDMALGNSVGSIICDTGLILGVACLMAPLPFDRRLVNRQGWVQFGAGVLLVAACFPWLNPSSAWTHGHSMSQLAGMVFCGLLAVYIFWSIKQSTSGDIESLDTSEPEVDEADGSTAGTVAKLFVAIFMVVAASTFLIASAEDLALRIKIPKSIISATIVAFGTSLPELITAITAVRKNQGELAVGNVIGADILNVLFVAGAAAAVTSEGLTANPFFFWIQFPAMLTVLAIFRAGIFFSKENQLSRRFGAILLAVYVAYTIVNAATVGKGGAAAEPHGAPAEAGLPK